MSYKIAVMGATSLAGREILAILSERGFPAAEVLALAPEKTAGQTVGFGDADIPVQALEKFDFRGLDLVFAASGTKMATTFLPVATAAGAIALDASGAYSLDPDVPLVVADVNAAAIEGYKKKNIIAMPDAATVQLVTALAPLHREFGVRRAVVSTYQSVSGAGQKAMDELFNQTRHIFMNTNPEANHLPKRIAFNVIPQVGDFMDDRASHDEWMMAAETKKILGSEIKIAAHHVRVPVFIGHGMMVNVECVREGGALAARALWLGTPGITLIDLETDMGYVTPVDVQGEDSVFVSRTRDDPTLEYGLSFWCAADNIRKGTALNAVQIAEKLVKGYL